MHVGDDGGMSVLGLRAFADYLRASGWSLEDQDTRTALWRPSRSPDAGPPGAAPVGAGPAEIVLPVRQDVGDYADRIDAAVRTLAFAERRTPAEVKSDVASGGADTVAVRLTPDAPPGEAPLALAQAVVTALYSFVIGSAAAIEIPDLVLPSHRPPWAESYAGQVRLSTHPGSFILSLALPLVADIGGPQQAEEDAAESVMFAMPPQPLGRRVSTRMRRSAQAACLLADEVSAGSRPLRAFGTDRGRPAANATELAALTALGGVEYGLYQLRFTQSPLAADHAGPMTLQVTPGQQRILGEAADFLRARQPRAGVTVHGLVVRLHRPSAFGPGEVVIEGFDDESGATRRYRMELAEGEYNDAVEAHRTGLAVSVTGDREDRGTHLRLRRLTSFSVIPGFDYKDGPGGNA